MMASMYRIINFQFQDVTTFWSLEEAKAHITELQKTFSDESFCVVEWPIVYWSRGAVKPGNKS